MKKLTLLLAAVMLAALLGGCSAPAPAGESSSAAPVSVSPADETPLADVSADDSPEFSSLDALGQNIYRRILQGARDFNPNAILMPEEASVADIDRAFNAVLADRPELFWLEKKMTMVTNQNYVSIELAFSVASPEKAEKMTEELDAAAEEALALIPDDADAFTAELLLHDWLVRRVEYNVEVTESSTGEPLPFTAYGALVSKDAVCEGYARAMQLLLNRAKIPCRLISGKADGEDHMWNLVQLGEEKWVHLDTTWDDAISSDKDPDTVSHIYFNLTDDEISANHSDFDSPGCTSTDENYFTRFGLYFESYDDDTQEAIVRALASTLSAHEPTLELRFAPGEVYDAAYSALIGESRVLGLVTKANTLLGEPAASESEISFGPGDDAFGVLMLRPIYTQA